MFSAWLVLQHFDSPSSANRPAGTTFFLAGVNRDRSPQRLPVHLRRTGQRPTPGTQRGGGTTWAASFCFGDRFCEAGWTEAMRAARGLAGAQRCGRRQAAHELRQDTPGCCAYQWVLRHAKGYPINRVANGVLRASDCYRRMGAQERIRTSTPLRTLDPESSASASSATWAQGAVPRGKIILPCGPRDCQRGAKVSAAAAQRPGIHLPVKRRHARGLEVRSSECERGRPS